MEIRNEILDILSDYIDIPADEIDFQQPMKMAAGINSFVFLSMLSAMEERFNIQIPNEKLNEFKTLTDIESFIIESMETTKC